MSHSAVVFASLGAMVELAEPDRKAFNLAFHGADLDWIWEASRYRRLQSLEDDAARIATYAVDAGDMVDVARVLDVKRSMMRLLVERGDLKLRPGVADLIAAARARNIPVALCAKRPGAEVDAVLNAVQSQLAGSDLAWRGDSDLSDGHRTLAEVMDLALCALQLQADGVLAIVDTPFAARAAHGAGLGSVILHGTLGPGWQVPEGVRVLRELHPDLIHQVAIAAE